MFYLPVFSTTYSPFVHLMTQVAGFYHCILSILSKVGLNFSAKKIKDVDGTVII